MVATGQPYDEKKAFQLIPSSAARRLKHLQNQARALNMALVPANHLACLVIQEAALCESPSCASPSNLPARASALDVEAMVANAV